MLTSRIVVLLAPLFAALVAGGTSHTTTTRLNEANDSLALAPLPAYRNMRDCSPKTLPTSACRITAAPSRAEIERRLGVKPAVAWNVGDTFNIVYRASDDSLTEVEAGGGIQLPMAKLVGTRLWVLSLQMPGADSGVVSLDLYRTYGTKTLRDTNSLHAWRGPKAPPAPVRATKLAGIMRDDSIWSDALKTRRGITIYVPPGKYAQRLPVVYLADGANVHQYAPIIDPLIVSGALPPVVLVGIDVSVGGVNGGPATGPGNDLRAIEYHEGIEQIPGTDSAFVVNRYKGHKRLFTEEVRKWAEDSLHVSTDRRWRALQGNSSGCSYVMQLGRERADLYGAVIANSNGSGEDLVPPPSGWENAPRQFLSSGVLEPLSARVMRGVVDSLSKHGVPAVVNIYPSGHDYAVWTESLPRALAWWLKGDAR